MVKSRLLRDYLKKTLYRNVQYLKTKILKNKEILDTKIKHRDELGLFGGLGGVRQNLVFELEDQILRRGNVLTKLNKKLV